MGHSRQLAFVIPAVGHSVPDSKLLLWSAARRVGLSGRESQQIGKPIWEGVFSKNLVTFRKKVITFNFNFLFAMPSDRISLTDEARESWTSLQRKRIYKVELLSVHNWPSLF